MVLMCSRSAAGELTSDATWLWLYVGQAVPTTDLADELAAVTAAIRGVIDGDRYPHAPRLDPLRAALGKLEAVSKPKPHPKARRLAKTRGGSDRVRPSCAAGFVMGLRALGGPLACDKGRPVGRAGLRAA
jgi:hypothetical protein